MFVDIDCPICDNKTTMDLSRFRAHKKRGRKKKYCSRNCYNKSRMNGKILNCTNCNKEMYRPPCDYEKFETLYCSYDCQREYMVGENSPQWRGGWDDYKGENWYRQRRASRQRDNYKCRNCGISEKDYGHALDVHHIIPFRVFGYERYKEANDLKNLMSLCNSCHSAIEPRVPISGKYGGRMKTPHRKYTPEFRGQVIAWVDKNKSKYGRQYLNVASRLFRMPKPTISAWGRRIFPKNKKLVTPPIRDDGVKWTSLIKEE